MGRETNSWPAWDGQEPLQDRRIRLNYPNGAAYAVGRAMRQPFGGSMYQIAGTGILFGKGSRIQVAPRGTR